MATKIYLGYPPENVKNWILSRCTTVEYSDGTIKKFAIDNKIVCGEGGTPTSQIENINDVINLSVGLGVKTIDHDAFFLCKNLQRVIIPESVEEVGENAFFGCKNAKFYSQYNEEWDFMPYFSDMNQNYNIKIIKDNAFRGCNFNSDYIYILPKTTYLGKDAFGIANISEDGYWDFDDRSEAYVYDGDNNPMMINIVSASTEVAPNALYNTFCDYYTIPSFDTGIRYS
jgi:hypothetical protein